MVNKPWIPKIQQPHKRSKDALFPFNSPRFTMIVHLFWQISGIHVGTSVCDSVNQKNNLVKLISCAITNHHDFGLILDIQKNIYVDIIAICTNLTGIVVSAFKSTIMLFCAFFLWLTFF